MELRKPALNVGNVSEQKNKGKSALRVVVSVTQLVTEVLKKEKR